MLREYHGEPSNSSGILLKNVQSPVTGEVRVRTPLGDRVERGVMARGVASDPETHQELEGWTRSGDGISHERSLWSASKCEVPSGVKDGQPMWQPLSITHGDGGSIQPKDIDRQSLLSAQMRRLARMSHHSHKLLRKIRGTVPKEQRDYLSEIWGEELLGLEGENTSDHERQNVIGKPMVGAPNLEEIDVIHEKMMELEPLLEASGERNLRSIDLTHGDCPCHCLAQTVWYPDHANLCLIWDVEEIRSLGLPDHQQKVTILVVSTMLALRWIEENIAKYRESKTPTAESIHAIDYSRRLELFETACKVFAIPMEVRHMWSRLRFFPWFRATLTSWLYVVTKDHMRKHQKEYRQFQAEIGPDAFKRPLLTHRNAITTGWKRVGRVSRNNTRARESILEEDLAKNLSLSLHNSFCLNRESKAKSLQNQVKRLQEQREWMRSYEQLKAWEEIVISSDDEEALLKQITVSNLSGLGTSRVKNTR